MRINTESENRLINVVAPHLKLYMYMHTHTIVTKLLSDALQTTIPISKKPKSHYTKTKTVQHSRFFRMRAFLSKYIFHLE